MSNYLQYSHKIAEYQLRDLQDLDGEVLLQGIVELAGQHGLVNSVEKMGAESYQNYRRKIYLISFDQADDALSAAYAFEGKMFSKTSMILMLH